MLACCRPGFGREGAVPYGNGLIIIKTPFTEGTSGVHLTGTAVRYKLPSFMCGYNSYDNSLCLIRKY